MSRTFAYARVSTTDQTAANQLREIEAAGFSVDKRRVITESISGSVSADQRPGFAELLLKMEDGDVLIVTKLDRLGRNAMDVRSTVETLAERGIRIHCLALGGVDLTSAAGRMTMQVLNAVAEFERDLLIERTQAGIARAKAEGKVMGRRSALTKQQQDEVRRRLSEGETVAGLARQYGTSRQTIMRVRSAEYGSVITSASSEP
ncbi:recombinase family protein [Burkholderia stabilis]|uniref:Recombinase family protein n=2 Tax=Pseudomonadota TaxID=1224 RepID=A0A4Q2ARG3_9BURK|nr:recombinase family protein [Burkholderia stabilis]RXV72633.1 recombinase family protein [Burkholderia stabilis]